MSAKMEISARIDFVIGAMNMQSVGVDGQKDYTYQINSDLG